MMLQTGTKIGNNDLFGTKYNFAQEIPRHAISTISNQILQNN